MIEFFNPRMVGGEVPAIEAVIKSGWINEGKIAKQFETKTAEVCGRSFGVAAPNGTSAIAMALMACGARSGDDVIVSDFTYIATANAVRLAGCNVILADVDPVSMAITAEDAEAVRTAKTRFIIITEVNGHLPNYDELKPWCASNSVTMITDSCEGFGIGDCGSHGTASALSFSPSKLVTTGQGGMVVTDSEKIRDRLLELKQQGRVERGTGGAELHPTLGFNFKFSDVLAAIGLVQLHALPVRLQRCHDRALWYLEALKGCKDVEFRGTGPNLWTDIITDHQSRIVDALTRAGIACRQFWFPLHRQRPYAFNKEFPGAQYLANHGIWLPSSYDITRDEVEHVASVIKAMMSERMAA